MDHTMDHTLNEMSNDRRLEVYDKLISGIQHIYSKGKLQEDRLNVILDIVMPLRKEDPIFLVHLTSYIVEKSDNKDLKAIITLVNALSDADGSPFDSTDTELRKPNFRLVSHAAIQMLDPKQVRRIFELAGLKTSGKGRLIPRKFKIDNSVAVHIPRSLRNAVRKYLRYREQTPNGINGIVKAGLKNIFIDLFRVSHTKPIPTTAIKLRWIQKDGSVDKDDFNKSLFDFKGLTDVQIAEKIVVEKISARAVLGAIDNLTPVIAVAILQVASGDEVVILTSMLEDSGILKDKEVQKVYKAKVKESKNAIDRIKTFEAKVSREISGVLDEGRSEAKKKIFEEKVGKDIGNVFFHIDISGSMHTAIEWIKENSSAIIEMIPEDRFGWGCFNTSPIKLPKPTKYTSAGIKQVLYGRNASGGTDCLALYAVARDHGSDVDIYITDQCHTGGHYRNKAGRVFNDLADRIREFHSDNPDIPKPKACVIIDSTMQNRGAVGARVLTGTMVVSGQVYSAPSTNCVKKAYETNGIPVTVLPMAITMNSALLAEQMAIASKGRIAVIEEIMNHPLLHPPQWYFAINAK